MTAVDQGAEVIAHLPRCRLGESPRWDGRSWWWLDAPEGRIWSGTPDADGQFRARLRHYFGTRTTLVQPRGDGQRVVVVGPVVRVGTANPLRRLATLPTRRGEVFNDGVVDPQGRLLIGSVAAKRAPEGRLLRVELDGTVEVLREGFALSNGMAWLSPTELLHADSSERRIWLHDLAGDTSVIFAEFDDGMPDGLAVAADGSVWIAVYGTGEIRRLDTDGSVAEVITLPTPQVTSVAIGGPDGDDLLITTAREGFSVADSKRDPYAGCLFLAPGAAHRRI